MLAVNKVKKIFERMGESLKKSSFVFYLITAFFLNVVLEILSARSLYIFENPFMFAVNVLILAFMMSFSGFFKKRNFFTILVSFVWIFLGVTNFILLLFRITPLCGSDFAIVLKAVGIIGLYLSPIHIMLIILITGFVIFLMAFYRKREISKKVDIKKSVTQTAIFGALIGIVIFSGVLKPDFSDLLSGYRENGFVYSFLNTVFDRGIDAPGNYSEKRFSDAMRRINDIPKNDILLKPDIVFIQLESFFDVNYLENVEFSGNPIPNFTALKENYPHGFLNVPTVGGGTANTEFEVICGVSSKHFGAGEYPFETELKEKPCESMAYNLKEYGYMTHFIHNHSGDFYYRNKVYENLGFDTFTSVEYMNNVERNKMNWAKDSILTDYIKKALDSTEKSDFIFTVTVQTHGNYPSENGEDEMSRYSYYIREMKETDKFIDCVIKMLEERDKPAVAVFYGDHLPALKIENYDLENMNMYQTEYVIWNNIGLENKTEDLNSHKLSSHIFEKIGVNTGIVNKLNMYYKNNSEYERFSQILAYDIFGKEKKEYLKYYQSVQMKMGIDDIRVTQVNFDRPVLKVEGVGFTPYSVVYINNKKYKTEFVDENTLLAYDVWKFKDGGYIKVAQISSTNEKLSETLPFFNIQN